MAKSTINFEGASFKLTGSSATVRHDGYRYNEVQHKRIILSDGTQFDFDRYGWSRWIENKHYQRFPDSRGHHRKCNERYCNLLNQAWNNFTRQNRGANDN